MKEEPVEVRDAHPLLGGWSTVKRYDVPTTNNSNDVTEEENEEEEPNEQTITDNLYVHIFFIYL